MIISKLNKADAFVKNASANTAAPFFGLKMNRPLSADKVSFSASSKQKPQSIVSVTGFKCTIGEEYTSDELVKKFGMGKYCVEDALENGDIEIAEDKTYKVKVYTPSGPVIVTKDLLKSTFRIKNPDLSKYFHAPNSMNISSAARTNEFIRENDETASEEELEILGYGSKADIIANAGEGNYRFKKSVLKSGEFRLFEPEMRKALSSARKNNPAVVSIYKMPMPLTFALINGKVRSVKDIYGMEDPGINIADKKNLEYLRTVEIPDFQKWINEKLEAHAQYRKNNRRIFEEFKGSPKKIEIEIQKEVNAQKAKNEQLKAEEKRKKTANSLRMTIAWILSPNTREVMRQKINPHIKEIMKKYKAAQEVHKKLLLGEIGLRESEQALLKLNLTDGEIHDLMSYYHSCWETAGTEEWKKGLQQGGIIADIYVKHGIDGFESNDKLKQLVMQWIDNYNRKKLLFE